ncbi:MAG: oligosaccharide flippase family protein [Desulfitobacteriaceae bacterium]
MGFTKSVTITFFSNLLLFFLSIVTTTLLSRLLGPAGKGVVDVANNFLTFATLILGLGLAASNVFFLGKNKGNLRAVIGNNIFLTALSFIFLIPFYFLNARFQFQFLRGVSNFQMLIVLFSVPFANFKASMVNVLLGLQDVVEYNRINVLDKILNMVLLIGFLFYIVSPSSAILATLLGAVAVSLWEIFILLRYIDKHSGTKMESETEVAYSSRLIDLLRVDFPLMRQMLEYGMKAQVGNIIQRLNYRLDVFIVNFFSPISQVGIYGIAVALGETLWGVSGSIATVIFPIVSASPDKKEMYTFTNQVTRVSFALITLFSLVLALVSKVLIILWFGVLFAPASAALLWLLPGIAVFSISNILANYLAGVGLVEKNIYSAIVSGLVTIVLDFWFIPRIGINGASIATSISYIIFTLMTLFFYIRYTESRWQDILILNGGDLALIRKVIRQRMKRL